MTSIEIAEWIKAEPLNVKNVFRKYSDFITGSGVVVLEEKGIHDGLQVSSKSMVNPCTHIIFGMNTTCFTLLWLSP